MEQWYYDTYTTDGIYIDGNIKTELSALYNLITSLEPYNKLLVGMNETGVIIDYIPSYVDDVKSLETNIEEKIYFIKNDILSIEKRFNLLERHYLNVKDDIENLMIDNNNDDEKIKDVTGEFFLLIDSLPEKIKKELKIYIKKDNI